MQKDNYQFYRIAWRVGFFLATAGVAAHEVCVHLSNAQIALHSPAKVNLMLSVNGRREDGFHSLVSLVVPLGFGDEITVGLTSGQDVLHCTDPEVPTGADNLILKAATAFRGAIGREVFFRVDLHKRIPMGAGLGGGSSNAAVALLAMNQLLNKPLAQADMFELAALIGSDCPFFIQTQPAMMLGRGERIEPVDAELALRLRGRKLLLFRPSFGVETAWAYGRLAERAPQSYETESVAWQRLRDFIDGGDISTLLFNSFEAPVGDKYLAIASLLEQLRMEGINCLMSGSGSCCFALPQSRAESERICHLVRQAWGEATFLVETSIVC